MIFRENSDICNISKYWEITFKFLSIYAFKALILLLFQMFNVTVIKHKGFRQSENNDVCNISKHWEIRFEFLSVYAFKTSYYY